MPFLFESSNRTFMELKYVSDIKLVMGIWF